MSDIAGKAEGAKLPSYPLFDWLRFVLASVVVLDHAGLPLPAPLSGGLAVDVFLALSGWLIGGILLRTGTAELPHFFFNRSTRIWLPYAAAVLALYGLAAVREGVGPFWYKYLFYDVTFTHHLFTHFPQAGAEMPLKGSGNQFWSISVEEQFYLFAPALMLLLPWGKRLWTWLAVAAVTLWFHTLSAPIALGVVAAILQRDHGDWHVRPVARAALLAVAVAAVLVLPSYPAPFVRAAFAVVVVLLLATHGRRRALPMFLGGVSYPLYLNHWFGMFVAHAVAHVVPAVTGVALSLTGYAAGLLIGIAAYLAVDRPVMRWRQGWYSRRLGWSLAAAAYTLVLIGIVGGLVIDGRAAA